MQSLFGSEYGIDNRAVTFYDPRNNANLYQANHQNFRQNHRDPYGLNGQQSSQQRPVIVQMQAASVLATEQKTFCQVCTEFFDFLKYAAVGGLFVGYIVYIYVTPYEDLDIISGFGSTKIAVKVK